MIIAVDFDGFLFKEGGWPFVGEPLLDNIKFVKKLQADGNRLILWTCRTKEPLQRAIDACKSYGIEFVAVNEDDPELDWPHGNSRKVYADIYLDDRVHNPEQKRAIENIVAYLEKWKDQLQFTNPPFPSILLDIEHLINKYKA